jgi:putative ABC transport system permease protein
VVGDGASSEQVVGAQVSANYFATLGVRPALGRTFAPDEDRVASPVVVIGNGFWKRHFAGDPRVLGSTLALNGTAFKVVGVAPAGFTGPNTGLVAEVWTPLSMQPAVNPARSASASRSVPATGSCSRWCCATA